MVKAGPKRVRVHGAEGLRREVAGTLEGARSKLGTDSRTRLGLALGLRRRKPARWRRLEQDV